MIILIVVIAGLASAASGFATSHINSSTLLKASRLWKTKIINMLPHGKGGGVLLRAAYDVVQGETDPGVYLVAVCPAASGYDFKKLVENDRNKAYILQKRFFSKGIQEGLTAKTLPIKIYAELLSNIANAYLDGAGTVKNYSKAFYYYKLSAHLNFVTAQNYLAGMYYSGQGVHKNLKKANYWYCQTEKKGYKPSHPCKQ